MRKNKTFAAVVIFNRGRIHCVIQTAWLKITRNFTMSERDLHSYANGYCDAMGSDWTYDYYDEKNVEHRCAKIFEV